MPPGRLRLAASLVALAGLSLPAAGKDRLPGPVAADVIRTVDGDTIEVRANVWIGLDLTTSVRLRGIDAPEVRGKSPLEKQMAAAATRKLAEIAVGAVRLTDVEDDKYGGRVIADVTGEDGRAFSAVMLASGLVRAYDGGQREPWFGVASAE